MSEVENNEEVAVAETEVEVTNQGTIEDFVDAVAQQNFNRAKDHFDSIVGDKMNDAIEAERINVADSIFNDAPEEEQLELDLDDEEVVFDDETDVETATDIEEVDEVEEDDITVDEVEEFEDEEEVN